MDVRESDEMFIIRQLSDRITALEARLTATAVWGKNLESRVGELESRPPTFVTTTYFPSPPVEAIPLRLEPYRFTDGTERWPPAEGTPVSPPFDRVTTTSCPNLFGAE